MTTAGMNSAKNFVEPRRAAKHGVLTGDDLRLGLYAGGNERGDEVTRAHVLGERAADCFGDVVREFRRGHRGPSLR
ncbi:MAG: hypothetical protein A2W42_03370 [Candidatus Muproteobacteria bacterium RIFCSPHIGHO2_01_60_12]|nr:MAG: hypothetical protein A2W42_03370 [Candidatus Muproteobacteria bacterium RIFCSPHIGHO2_01_60_12]